jgi:hypothetical protein
MVVGVPLVLEGKPAVRDMVEVLEPLKERDGHTSSVDVQIWDYQDVPFDQDGVGSGCRRAVGSLGNYLKQDFYCLIFFSLNINSPNFVASCLFKLKISKGHGKARRKRQMVKFSFLNGESSSEQSCCHAKHLHFFSNSDRKIRTQGIRF